MARNFFYLVPHIVLESKYVDVSIAAVLRAVCSEKFKPQFTREIIVADADGAEVSIALTVNIGGSLESIAGWSVALMMHSVRIDGIDHEFEYLTSDGKEAQGWHRHVWSESLQEADTCKIPIEGFDDCATLENFLFRISRAMNITWNRADNADLFEVKN